VRVFGILAVLLLIVVGIFLYLRGENFWPADEPVTAEDKPISADQTPPAAPQKSTGKDEKKPSSSQATVIDKDLGDEKEAALRPSFDIVRIDRNCELLVAGRGVPSSVVTIYVGDQDAGVAKTSARGEWVFTSTNPIVPGSQTINLIAKNPDGSEVESGKLVAVSVPDCTKPMAERNPAIAVLTPKDGSKDAAGSVKLLQLPEPKGDVSAAKGLSLGAVNYDEKGNLQLSGKGIAGNIVTVYVDNQPIGSVVVGEDGSWSLTPDSPVSTGTYTLRIDQLDRTGKVLSRVELPFQRAPASDVILAQENGRLSAIVQPGNSLWRIATRAYGEGAEYTVIYQANKDQIRDPDLIYPGQIFALPGSN